MGTLLGVAGLYVFLRRRLRRRRPAADLRRRHPRADAVRGHADAPDRRRAGLQPLGRPLCRRCWSSASSARVMGARCASTRPGTSRAGGRRQPTDVRHRQRASDQYVLPFELASVVLLAALVGAVVLSRKELQGRAGGAWTESGSRTSWSSACWSSCSGSTACSRGGTRSAS